MMQAALIHVAMLLAIDTSEGKAALFVDVQSQLIEAEIRTWVDARDHRPQERVPTGERVRSP
jgi:hypothetical protein